MGNAAVITAAGSSVRFGNSKKEFRTLGGHSVLYCAVCPFVLMDEFDIVVITYRKGDLSTVRELLGDLLEKKEFLFVEGGQTRQSSVLNALSALENRDVGFVSIHDGARPYVTEDLIRRVLCDAYEHKAAAASIPVSDTVVISDGSFIKRRLERSSLRALQTPQIFDFRSILKLHRQAEESDLSFTDDTQVYLQSGGTVYLSEGSTENRKITYPEDLR